MALHGLGLYIMAHHEVYPPHYFPRQSLALVAKADSFTIGEVEHTTRMWGIGLGSNKNGTDTEQQPIRGLRKQCR